MAGKIVLDYPASLNPFGRPLAGRLCQASPVPTWERMKSGLCQLVVFSLGEARYALRLAAVERVIPMVEITPLPKAPAIVLGVVDVQGRVIPVVDPRRRFRMPEQEFDIDDQLLIARSSQREVALVVNRVSGVVNRSEAEVVAAGTIVPGLDYVEGVARLPDGLVLIHDLDTFLSLEEQAALAGALQP